jgi:hypothetical protein
LLNVPTVPAKSNVWRDGGDLWTAGDPPWLWERWGHTREDDHRSRGIGDARTYGRDSSEVVYQPGPDTPRRLYGVCTLVRWKPDGELELVP